MDSLQSKIQNPKSKIAARGLTLIELLVTVVIMVTLLAAVLPAVSPNNDGRKIREAARQLSSLISQAQAQAARDGRAVGVGFSDVWTDANKDGFRDLGETSGMALEAYIIAEPPPFAGFSEDSSIVFRPTPNTAPPVGPNQPPLLNVRFAHGVGGEGYDDQSPADVLPPRMFRGAFLEDDGDIDGSGDWITVGQEVFEILSNDLDDPNANDVTPNVEMHEGIQYLASQKEITVRWLTWRNRDMDLELWPQGGQRFRIRRQPSIAERPSRTAAAALQFPRGVGVDMDPTEGDSIAAIMFSPTGRLEAEYRDGNKLDDRDPVFILLGRVENANPVVANPPSPSTRNYDIDLPRYDFRAVPDGTDGDEELDERREQVNLLNADSQWVAIAPSGRVTSAENFVFDPREVRNDPSTLFLDALTGDDETQVRMQRERWKFEAQAYARRFENTGGR